MKVGEKAMVSRIRIGIDTLLGRRIPDTILVSRRLRARNRVLFPAPVGPITSATSGRGAKCSDHATLFGLGLTILIFETRRKTLTQLAHLQLVDLHQ